MKVALFVISGEMEHFVNFANSKYSKAKIQVIRYNPTVSKREVLRELLNVECDAFLFCCDNLEKLRKKRLLKVFSLFIRAKEKYFVDKYDKLFKCTVQSALLEAAPLLIVEFMLCFLVFVFGYLFCFVMSRIPRHRRLEFHNNRLLAYLGTEFSFDLKAGGSVTHTSGFASGVLKNGYRLFFISSDLLENMNKNVYPFFVVKPYSLDISTCCEFLYNLRFIVKGLRILKAINPDFLYQRYSRLNFAGVVLARLMKIPLFLEYNSSKVWVARYFGSNSLLVELIRSAETLNLKHADVIVVVSNALKRKLLQEGVGPDRILVNPNCVNARMFHPSIDSQEIRNKYHLHGKTVVGWVGTFGFWHGVDLLASAIPYVVEKNKNIHFLLIGDGVGRDKIERTVREEQLDTFVTFTGMIPHYEMPKYLAACNILVAPHTPLKDGSEFFGSPTKLFEYMAMEKGIVASNLGQIGNVLHQNDNAYLVKPGDRRELASGILELAEDDVLRNKLAKKAREDVIAKYTWKKNAERVIEMYKKIAH